MLKMLKRTSEYTSDSKFVPPALDWMNIEVTDNGFTGHGWVRHLNQIRKSTYGPIFSPLLFSHFIKSCLDKNSTGTTVFSLLLGILRAATHRIFTKRFDHFYFARLYHHMYHLFGQFQFDLNENHFSYTIDLSAVGCHCNAAAHFNRSA